MKISRPTRPKSTVFTCYRYFLRVCIRPFRADAGRQHALRDGRETRTRPKRARASQPCAPIKSTQKGTLQQGSVALKFSTASLLHALQRCCQPFEMLERSVWFGARGARKFKFSHFFGLLLRVRSGRPLHIYRPTGCSSTGTAPGLEKCKGDMPMTNVRKNSTKLTCEDLKIAPESPTMKLSETPAVEPSDQTSKTVRHAPLVYRVEEIVQLLAISNRAAYNLCNTTKDFKVIRLGTSIRVSKQSFDDWFAAV